MKHIYIKELSSDIYERMQAENNYSTPNLLSLYNVGLAKCRPLREMCHTCERILENDFVRAERQFIRCEHNNAFAQSESTYIFNKMLVCCGSFFQLKGTC
jgi:hypothetical protein